VNGDDQISAGTPPEDALDRFRAAADRAGENGLDESEFRNLASLITSLLINERGSKPSATERVLEQIADLCSQRNANVASRTEFQRLGGRLLADLPPEIQSAFVKVCLGRLNEDVLGGRGTQDWRPIAYLLAANYSLIRWYALRRELIEMLNDLIYNNPGYKNDFFIEDLLLVHKNMRLGVLERLKERYEAGAHSDTWGKQQ
jgi:hypothetical protein